MFDALAPSTTGPAAEIGAGIGTFSRLLRERGMAPLLLLEPDATCATELRREFAADDRVEIVQESVPGSNALARSSSSLSYALCQNVLEHIDDDAAALAEIVGAVRPGGEIAILVPAHPRLFNRLDDRFGHYRRYTRESLSALVEASGAELSELRSFNLLGALGWWVGGHTGAVDITKNPLRVYETLLPLWQPVEERLRPAVGLSLIARARRAQSEV